MYNTHKEKQERRISRNPCFNNYDFHSSVLHLPVVSSNNVIYNEQFSTAEGRSGTGLRCLTPEEAFMQFKKIRGVSPGLTVAAIAGPGEPLTDFDAVRETFRLIKSSFPETILCISTNGLLLPIYASHLISIGLDCVCIHMDSMNPVIGDKLYHNIQYLGRQYTGVEAANILLQNQMAGVSYLRSFHIPVRMNIHTFGEVNTPDMEELLLFAKKTGCTYANVRAFREKNYENGMEAYYGDSLCGKRPDFENLMPQSYFCKACSPASFETLNMRMTEDITTPLGWIAMPKEQEGVRCRIAVCSKTGVLTDEHFGHAETLYIYEYFNGRIRFLETRTIDKYCTGNENGRENGNLYSLMKAMEDCNGLICLRIGACPAEALKDRHIQVYTTYNLIEDGIREAIQSFYEQRDIRI